MIFRPQVSIKNNNKTKSKKYSNLTIPQTTNFFSAVQNFNESTDNRSFTDLSENDDSDVVDSG